VPETKVAAMIVVVIIVVRRVLDYLHIVDGLNLGCIVGVGLLLGVLARVLIPVWVSILVAG